MSKDKKLIIEKLKSWSENAITSAEIEQDPGVESLRAIILEAKSAGMKDEDIKELIWSPYSDEVEYSAYTGEDSDY